MVDNFAFEGILIPDLSVTHSISSKYAYQLTKQYC